MWKSLVVVLIVAFSSVSWSFLIEDGDLLMYFNKTILSVQPPDLMQKPISLEYNSTNAEVDYDVTTTAPTLRNVKLTFKQKVPVPPREDIKVSRFELSLLFIENGGYFSLANTTANIIGTVGVGGNQLPFGNASSSFQLVSEIALEAPKDRSFHCSQFGRLYPDFNARVGNYTPSVELRKLQMQMFNVTAGQKPKFEESWDCVGFFTAGIWSGIFIAGILIGIITLGLGMIMDVKTNDRFDDPKGKPISFGGTE